MHGCTSPILPHQTHVSDKEFRNKERSVSKKIQLETTEEQRKALQEEREALLKEDGAFLKKHKYFLPLYWIRLNFTRLLNYNKKCFAM